MGVFMIQISREAIKKLVTNDAIYSRGLRYYNNKAILNVTWSKQNHQYHAIVQGKSDYNVSINVKEDDSFDYHCNCPASYKYSGACKHVVATLLFLYDYVKKLSADVPSDPDEKKIYNIIEYFDKEEALNNQGDVFHLKLHISIPSIIKGNGGKAFISIWAGSNRMYKVQSLKKFLGDYMDKVNISLGKEFRFVAGENKFDEDSKKILDYLLEIYEIQESLGKVYYSNLFTKSQMVFSKNMLLRMLQITKGAIFELELYGKALGEVTYSGENPNIKYELNVDEEALTIDYNGKEEIIPVTDNGELLYSEHVLYHPNKNFIKNYVPFYNNLGKNKAPLVFKGENKHKFLEVVLPKLYETMNIDIPEEMKSQYITSDLQAKIFLDRSKAAITAEIKFQYGEYEFNPLDYHSDSVIIIRQVKKENQIFDMLGKFSFEPYKFYFIMKDEKSIFEFLTEKIQELGTLCQLYYSEEFKKIKVNQPHQLNTMLKVSSRIDLLEMELDFEEIPKEELKDMFQSLKLKKKFYRLKNGTFIGLENPTMNRVLDLFDNLDLSVKDLKNNKISLPKGAALYLDSMLADQDEIHATKNEEFQRLIDTIQNPGALNFNIPDGINATLRPYQVTGFRWLKTLASFGLGGILADDMGLGKTLQSIVYMADCILEDNSRLHLVVCPSSLVYNWQDEIENFAPFLKSTVIAGTPEERQRKIEDYKSVNIIITSYPLMRRDGELYEKIDFHTMFIDEAQFIKNANSLNAKSVKRIQAAHRFALTGTPIENSLSELWSIFDYAMPGYLLSHTKFVNRYEKPIMKEDSKALTDLGQHIHPFILRRMKKEVLKELPEKVETKIITDLTESQKKVYMSYMMQIKAEIASKIEKDGYEKSHMQILAALTRLRQICCHPGTFIENYKGGSGKLELLMELLSDAIENEHRILIFSQFTSMLQIIEKELEKSGIEYFYLEGSTPLEHRNDFVKRFNGGERKVFLISLKAGGTGLNLTGADMVVHFDPWWNPAVEEQATDRVYRMGQTNSVQVIKLITKGTIEEKIFLLQQKKKELSDSIIQSKEVFINKLSKEELEDIFS